MRASVEFTYEEIKALHRAAILTHQLAAAYGHEDEWRALAPATRRLAAAINELLCRHCHSRPSRRSNRLCDRCNLFAATHGGVLPAERVLVATSQGSSARRRLATV